VGEIDSVRMGLGVGEERESFLEFGEKIIKIEVKNMAQTEAKIRFNLFIDWE